jgi:hypothetical protein
VTTRSDSPEEIRSHIEKTRSELGETIDAMADRLNPTALKEQTKDAIRDATLGKAEETLNDAAEAAKGVTASMRRTIQENPIPAALAGIGIGWLVMKGRQARTNSGSQHPFNGMSFSPQSSNTGIAQQVGDIAGSGKDHVEHAVTSAQQSAIHAVDQTRDQAEHVLHESPLVAGGIALALGAVAGFALQPSESENRMFGAKRDELMSQLKSTAREAQAKIEQVAADVRTTVEDEVESAGFARS